VCDYAQQSTDGDNSQTYNLDVAQRIGNTQAFNDIDGTWTLTDTTTNHYDSDDPDWTGEDSNGSITRGFQGIDEDLAPPPRRRAVPSCN